MSNIHPPILLFVAGTSGSGKTTILERLIPELKNKGLRVGTVKHHHDKFNVDIPGKDSWRHKNAGAEKTIISSPNRIGIVMDTDHDHSPEELVYFLTDMDIVLVEGYKGVNLPKVEIFRQDIHERPLCLQDKNLIAIVTDTKLDLSIPRFGLEAMKELADFIVRYFGIALGKGNI